jgi:hypothetical protein
MGQATSLLACSGDGNNNNQQTSLADLLRILPACVSPCGTMIDRFELIRGASLSSSPLIANDLRVLWHTLDALRHIPLEENQGMVAFVRADWDSVITHNQSAMIRVAQSVARAALLTDIAQENDPLTRLINKALNARCHDRKYGTACQELLFATAQQQQRYNDILSRWRAADATWGVNHVDMNSRRGKSRSKKPERRFVALMTQISPLRQQFAHIILNCILGNLSTCESRMENVRARKVAHQLLFDTSTAGSSLFLQALFHARNDSHELALLEESFQKDKPIGAAHLVKWCIREFIVFCMIDNPALQAELSPIMCFDKFRTLVSDVMRLYRRYLDRHLAEEWSDLGKFAAECIANRATSALKGRCDCLDKTDSSGRAALHQRSRKFRLKCIQTGVKQRVLRRCAYARMPWLADLAAIVEPFRLQILNTQYLKSRTDFAAWLTSAAVRVHVPLVSLLDPDEVPPATITDMEQESKQEEEHDEHLFQNLLQQRGGTSLRQQTHQQKRMMDHFQNARQNRTRIRSLTNAAREHDERVNQDVLRYLPPAYVQMLQRVVALVHAEGMVGLLAALLHMPSLGVDAEAVTYIRALLSTHCNAAVASKKLQLKRLAQFQQLNPHAYNVLQVAAELWKEPYARVIGLLSQDATFQQIRAQSHRMLTAFKHLQQNKIATLNKFKMCPPIAAAIQECTQEMDRLESAWKANGGDWQIDPVSSKLFYCDVCFKVYTSARAKASGSTFYRYGLIQATRDFGDTQHDRMYCSQNKVTPRGSCYGHQLSCASLLGVRVELNEVVYQLCGRCGDAMCVEELCTFDQQSLICSACVKAAQVTHAQVMRAFTETLDTSCACCLKSISVRHRASFYGRVVLMAHGIVLCYWCSKMRAVIDLCYSNRSDIDLIRRSPEALREALYNARKNHNQRKQAKRAQRDQQRMKLTRRKDRMRRK